MKLLRYDNDQSLGEAAARFVLQRMLARRTGTICLASGSTPTSTYKHLARLIAEDQRKSSAESHPDPWRSSWNWLQLDEWGGIPPGGAGTCELHLRETLVGPIGVTECFRTWQLTEYTPQQACDRMRAWIQEHGPIELSVLGLGVNGHLGFNEPGDVLLALSHVAELSAASLSHRMIQGCSARPTCGVTLGMADLLQSREIVLLVSGSAKLEILQKALVGPITPRVPASFLQLHRMVTVFTDQNLENLAI
jgi:galactosamine-6-phosphate isomerase